VTRDRGISEARWQLYRLLSEPIRLRLLALAEQAELTLGELSELLAEAPPNVSRHATQLRQAGLLTERRQGTRTFLRLSESALADAVVVDALEAGRALCQRDQSLLGIASILQAREARELATSQAALESEDTLQITGAYRRKLSALREALRGHELSVLADVGEGSWLDVLAPLYRRVIALAQDDTQLGRVSQRIARNGEDNVSLLPWRVGDPAPEDWLGAGADLVVVPGVQFSTQRVAPLLRALSPWLRSGGRLLMLEDSLERGAARVARGAVSSELSAAFTGAGLERVRVCALTSAWQPPGAASWTDVALTAVRS